MTTYSKWLEMQSGRDDMIGEVAKIWAAAGQTGNRPKVHSPTGVANWFAEQYHAEPERVAAYKQAIEAGMTERQREATAHLHAVPPAGDPVGSQIVVVLQAMQVLLEAHSRQLERVELALGIDPVEGSVPPPEHLRPWVAAVNASVTRPLPDGDLTSVWPELWNAADHSATAE